MCKMLWTLLSVAGCTDIPLFTFSSPKRQWKMSSWTSAQTKPTIGSSTTRSGLWNLVTTIRTSQVTKLKDSHEFAARLYVVIHSRIHANSLHGRTLYTKGFARIRCTVVTYTLKDSHEFVEWSYFIHSRTRSNLLHGHIFYTQGFARIRCTVTCVILDLIALKVIFLKQILRNTSKKKIAFVRVCLSRNRCNLLIWFMSVLLVTNYLLVPHLILLYLAVVFYFETMFSMFLWGKGLHFCVWQTNMIVDISTIYLAVICAMLIRQNSKCLFGQCMRKHSQCKSAKRFNCSVWLISSHACI